MSDKLPINKITWRCPRCGASLTTASGSKWVLLKGLKRRICPACVADREAKVADRSVVTEDLRCTTRHDLPPIPEGFPVPFELWHHG